MRQINLLPLELKPSKQFGIAAKKTIKYFVVFFIFYLLLVSSGIGFVYYLDGKLKGLTESKATLSAEVKSLSNIQTSVINIRDRVSKLDSVKGRDFEITGLGDLGELYKSFPVNSKISDITISDNEISFAVSAPDTEVFIYTMDKLTTAGIFKEISLAGIKYSQDTGYEYFLKATF